MPEGHDRMTAERREAALALLRWYVEMGADEAIMETAQNRLADLASARPRAEPAASPPSAPSPPAVAAAPPADLAESPAEGAQSARVLAAGATTVEELAARVAAFDGCPLKFTATNTVFADGNSTAP